MVDNDRGKAMSISSVSVVPPAVPSTAVTLPTNTAGSSTSVAAAPVDTVALSQGAQQFLSAAVVAPPDSSSQPDAVTQAISFLNNTDGSVSVEDQLQAYDLTVNFVQGPIAGSSNVFDPSKADAMVALLDSPFSQHVQQVLNTVNAPKELYATFTDGNQPANALDRSLTTFNALSASDQQIYISEGTAFGSADDYRANKAASADVDRALQAAMSSPAYATALSKTTNAVTEQEMGLPQYLGNRVADLGVLAAAAGDQATMTLVKLAQSNGGTADWSQQVQAYFADNGPPPAAVPTASTMDGYTFDWYGHGMSNAYGTNQVPVGYQAPDGKTLVAALAATWDTTGKVSITDQTAAEQTLQENFLFSRTRASMAVLDGLGESPFEKQMNAAAADFFWNPAVMAAESGNTDPQPSQTVLGLLNALPIEQQQLVFAGSGFNVPTTIYEGYKMVYAATLDDWKTQLAQQAVTNHAAYLADQASATAAAAAGTTPAVSALDAASIAASNASASAAAKALAALTSPASTSSSAAVALVLMRNAAKATATAKVANDKSAASPIKSSTAKIPVAPRTRGTVSVTA
jgi:hypothetical protein